jgi:hypothetical protein
MPDLDAIITAALADARAAEPTDAQIAAALRGARRRRPARRLVPAIAVTAAAALLAGAVVSLPGQHGVEHALPATLEAAAAAAGRAPAPGAGGYRYVKVIDQLTYANGVGGYVLQQRNEAWVDEAGHGRQVFGTAQVIRWLGDTPTAQALAHRSRRMLKASEQPFTFGDGLLARVPLTELPTDPHELARFVIRHHFAYGRPGFSQAMLRYDCTRELLALLAYSKASPALRAAAFRALPELGNVAPASTSGTAASVTISFPGEARTSDPDGPPSQDGTPAPLLGGANANRPLRLTVVVDTDTGELLSWSEVHPLRFAPPTPATAKIGEQLVGESHTYAATGQVARTSQRP